MKRKLNLQRGSRALAILFLVTLHLLSASSAFAQGLDAPAKQALFNLCTSIQKAISENNFNYLSSYVISRPIDPRLSALGSPIIILLTEPVPAQGLYHFNATIAHENGTSNWSFGLMPPGQIVAFGFTISALQSAPSNLIRPNRDLQSRNDVARGGIDRRSGGWAAPGPPADPGPPPVQVLPSPPPPVQADPRVVEFLFATTRAQRSAPTAIGRYSGERATTSFGAASVRYPRITRSVELSCRGAGPSLGSHYQPAQMNTFTS